MKIYATIKANDEEAGEIIQLGYENFIDDEGNKGYKICASNGDDIGYFRAQTIDKCCADISAMWSHWNTYEEV